MFDGKTFYKERQQIITEATCVKLGDIRQTGREENLIIRKQGRPPCQKPHSPIVRYASDNAFSKGTIVSHRLAGGDHSCGYCHHCLRRSPHGDRPRLQPAHSWSGWASMRTLDAGHDGRRRRAWPFLLGHAGRHPRRHLRDSTLIGVLTSGIEGRLEELRKGRSRVIESDHTVILGWSQQVFTIVTELVMANANQKRLHRHPRRQDKVEMEDEIRATMSATPGTRASSAAPATRSTWATWRS